MSENSQREEPRMIPYYEHEKVLMHYGAVNRRSMVMLIVTCVTLLLVTAVLVFSNTARENRDKKIIEELVNALRQPAAVEVDNDGVHEQPDP